MQEVSGGEKRGEAEKEVEHGEAAESSSEGDRGRKKTKHRESGWDPKWTDMTKFRPWLYHTDQGEF